MEKKVHQRGGICKFFDDWAGGGGIDFQKLLNASLHPEKIDVKKEHSTESYIIEDNSEEMNLKEDKNSTKPFNKDYKIYGKEN